MLLFSNGTAADRCPFEMVCRLFIDTFTSFYTSVLDSVEPEISHWRRKRLFRGVLTDSSSISTRGYGRRGEGDLPGARPEARRVARISGIGAHCLRRKCALDGSYRRRWLLRSDSIVCLPPVQLGSPPLVCLPCNASLWTHSMVCIQRPFFSLRNTVTVVFSGCTVLFDQSQKPGIFAKSCTVRRDFRAWLLYSSDGNAEFPPFPVSLCFS